MAIWSLEERDDGSDTCLESRMISPSLYRREGFSTSSTPRLEVSEINSTPFLQDFAELFEGLGLHISAPFVQRQRCADPDASYDLENVTNIRDYVPDWEPDEIEDIVVMSSKRPHTLPTIHEGSCETSPIIASATLSDFSFNITETSTSNYSSSSRICTLRESGAKYIVKRMRVVAGPPSPERTILETLTELSVPFVTHLRWVFLEGEWIYNVTDYYPNGSLLDLVRQHGSLGSLRSIFYASELVVALSSLHAAGIIHQALEPRNVMFDAEGHLVVTNFSRANSMSSTESRHMSEIDLCGYLSLEYQAPEIILGWHHNMAADCWSFGMVVYFMLFGAHPFKATEDNPSLLYDQILRSPIPAESLRLISPVARDLIVKCLERNASVRWTIDKIKSHSYFELVDWEKVALKQLEVPSSMTHTASTDFLNYSEVHAKHVAAMTGAGGQCAPSPSVPNRRSVSIPPDLFKPLPRVIIPSIITEEDEPISESETTGHDSGCQSKNRRNGIDKAKRMSRFWDNLDRDECGSVVSGTSQEFGESGTREAPRKAPKLRKHRSSIHPQRLFQLSATSFQKKLHKKPRSAATLRQPKKIEPIENLPLGIHQMGSGIGFTYNLPTVVPSALSVASFAPASCNIFQGGLSVLNLGLALGHSAQKDTLSTEPYSGALAAPSADSASYTREFGGGTFIRDMYRTPSWILSPPDSLPSPLVVGISASPHTESPGPLTPATLVDGDDEVNISIPKGLELEYELPEGVGSTLRLVPPSPYRLSHFNSGDSSLFTDFSET